MSHLKGGIIHGGIIFPQQCSAGQQSRKEKFEFRVGILLALGSKAQEVELEQREVNSEANEVSGPGF